MDDIEFLSNVFNNVLRPQQKVVDQELLVLVDKLSPNTWSRVEVSLELRLVHFVDSADVFHQHGNRVLGQVSGQVLPDEATLLRHHNKSVRVQDITKVFKFEILQSMV